MNTITPELYNYTIAEAEEAAINQRKAGFVLDICGVSKLMFSHILIHAIENFDIFTEDEQIVINNLVNKTL